MTECVCGKPYFYNHPVHGVCEGTVTSDVRVEHIESYCDLLEHGQSDKDLARDDAVSVAMLLRRALQTALDFGHAHKGLAGDGFYVARWRLAALLDRDDVSGDATYGPLLARAKEIVWNI